MAVHQLSPTRWFSTIGNHPPALTVDDGDTVVAQAIDANGADRHGTKVHTGPNPMTGPIVVRGGQMEITEHGIIK